MESNPTQGTQDLACESEGTIFKSKIPLLVVTETERLLEKKTKILHCFSYYNLLNSPIIKTIRNGYL